MSRVGVLQTDVGAELLEEVKREAGLLGLSTSAYVRMLLKQRNNTRPLSEKGDAKKRASMRAKTRALGTNRKP